MKKFLVRVLPEPALLAARYLRDRIRLSTTPRLTFNPENLSSANALDLSAIFADPDIGQSWASDGPDIAGIFGEDDRFGGVNPGDRRALYYLVRALQPKNILEIGTHIGASTINIAAALNRNGSGHLDTVDIYDVNDPETGSWQIYGQERPPRESIAGIAAEARVTFHTEEAQAFLGKSPGKYDVIFLDGDHSGRAVYNEVSLALNALTPHGVIILHDYYPDGKPLFPVDTALHGPWLAGRRIMDEIEQITIMPLGDLPWPTKAGVNTTSLALLLRT